jgi:undecaprenyl-diphosphatase
MFETIDHIDRAVLLLINGLHAPLLDVVMVAISKVSIWIPLYLFIVSLLVYQYGIKSVSLVAAIGILIAIVDVSSTQIIKPAFERSRPCHVHSLQPYLNLPDGCGGEYGFVSNHAGNTFALATFLTLMLSFKHPRVKYLYVWAFFVSMSRIYLGKHYPLDVFFGAIYGTFWAFIVYQVYLMLSINFIRSKFFLRKWTV